MQFQANTSEEAEYAIHFNSHKGTNTFENEVL